MQVKASIVNIVVNFRVAPIKLFDFMFSLEFGVICARSSPLLFLPILVIEHRIVDSTTKPSTRSSQSLVILIESAHAVIIFFVALLQNVILVATLTPVTLLSLFH